MIAVDSTFLLAFRWLAPLVWRSELKVAEKLEGFAATEAGSALDMLRAAELVDDPKLCRLFFRHAMDEARHALLFREAARRLVGGSHPAGSEYDLIHARRQNLFERLGLLRFVAFVYLAERRGELQFLALARHFRGRPELQALFARIAAEERFHVAYSLKLLRGWRADGRAAEVRGALWRVRSSRAFEMWRRSGRVFGDALSRAILGLLYLTVIPLFAAISRLLDPEHTGWKRRKLRASLQDARRQF